MAKDPAFLFYPNDYIGGTMGMTLEQKGAYMELLIMQFNVGHMEGHMCGQLVGQNWDKVKHKFKQDNEGKYFNERLEEEKNKRKSFTDSRKNNLKGQNQYTKKRGHMDGRMTSHMENENENRNENINGIENTEKVEQIFSSERWKEMVCMKKHIPKEQLEIILKHFLDKEILKSDFKNKSPAEIKDHFVNWLELKIEKKLNDGTTKNKHDNALNNFMS